MQLLENKTALITGGSRGIGAGLVKHFAKSGANVAFTYRSSADASNQLIESLNNCKVSIKAYQSDASSYESAEELVKTVLEDFGQIDILVNNAGITRDNLILRMQPAQWDEVMDNNLKSVFNLTKQVVRPMMKNRSGSIINMSSVVGVGGNAGQANYAASKAGIIGFTKSIAQELGSRNIRCNAIAPGFIETEMTEELKAEVKEQYMNGIPMKRFGSVDEVAQTAVFLASDSSSYISGQVISVCGALSC